VLAKSRENQKAPMSLAQKPVATLRGLAAAEVMARERLSMRFSLAINTSTLARPK
jgi:hypothetical protein